MDIKNKAQIFGLSVRHPVIRKADQELAFFPHGRTCQE